MNVIGNVNLKVIIPVDDESETLGLLQANYKVNPDRIVKWKLSAVDCTGHEEIIEVCDCDSVDLSEVI